MELMMMSITMNEKSMMKELLPLLTESEKYVSVSWATLSRTTPKLYAFILGDAPSTTGNLNNYCYVGITKSFLNIVLLNPLDVTRVTGKFHIPLTQIKNIAIKNNFLRCTITFFFENENFTMSWLNGSGGTGIKSQKQYIQRMIKFLSKYYSI
ncbi:MAG: hypothetical protein SPH17_03135 [Faecalicoccus sp.]|uniref:hypothetical protein n=1 Tax=Faecalicoccus sp. TaxID=1971758 RepID=UPI002A917EB1|nr:hypothetical protein [Faecalicoccus sp.]MDY5232586.1 hypothetical protein [Faecalicoccus sp.]